MLLATLHNEFALWYEFTEGTMDNRYVFFGQRIASFFLATQHFQSVFILPLAIIWDNLGYQSFAFLSIYAFMYNIRLD